MTNLCILTNNPLSAEKYVQAALFLDTSVGGIFVAARDMIHLGARIINHPLSGSIKPNESPYKSLVLSTERGAVDLDSLRLIEGAREVLAKLGEKKRAFSEKVLEDFMVIDLDLLDSAILSLPAQYHF